MNDFGLKAGFGLRAGLGLRTGLGGSAGLGDNASGAGLMGVRGSGVNGFGFGLGLGFGLVSSEGLSCCCVIPSSEMPSTGSLGTLAGIRLGELRFTGSPARLCSNIEISDPVGAIGPESTISPLLDKPSTLVLLRGVLALGLGLALRLAASVAAMKLALLGSVPPLAALG